MVKIGPSPARSKKNKSHVKVVTCEPLQHVANTLAILANMGRKSYAKVKVSLLA